MPHELFEGFDSYWSLFLTRFGLLGTAQATRKSVDPVSPEDVHASLLIFPLALLAQDLQHMGHQLLQLKPKHQIGPFIVKPLLCFVFSPES